MTKITVPVVDERPDTITPIFEAECAISFEAANPYAVLPNSGDPFSVSNPNHPTLCQPGGPGTLGGPEYINLLQRATSVPQTGYRVENFDLAEYPNHTFYSFRNSDTAVKNVVAFTKAGETIPTDIAPVIEVAQYSTTLLTGLDAVATAMPGTYAWGLTGGTITSGQGTNAIKWTAGAAGPAVFTCVFTNAVGVVAPSATPTTSTIVAAPVATITSTTPVAKTTGGLTATVPVQSGSTYLWTITDNGTVTSGDTTASLVWASLTAGTATLHATVINAAGTSATTTKVITVSV